MTECLRCGRCCFIRVPEGKFRCPHLVFLPSGKTLCRHYKDRLGKDIGHGAHCSLRENVHKNFVGCPFNNAEWGDELE